MNHYRSLYLDESGKADISHPSSTFILSACSFPEINEKEIREIANRIIFKYWGSDRSYKMKYKVNSIVFHAIDIARKQGPFVILNNKEIEQEFWRDLYNQILCRQDINFYIVIVDKEKTNKIKTWSKNTTLKKAYQVILKQFCDQLLHNKETGNIIAESSQDQDIALVTAFNTIQRNSGLLYKNPTLVSKTITSLSLINKHDNAIGSQIADIMAWVGKNKFLINKKTKKFNEFIKIDQRNIELLKRKTSSKAYRNKYNYFVVIP